MLEIAKILHEIDALGRAQAELLAGLKDEFSAADRVIGELCKDPEGARARLKSAKTSWLTADFTEPPDRVHALPPLPGRHTVLAVDGSQIVPDRQEVTLCYLLNAASIVLPYGLEERPRARSVPRLCYKDEDLFERCGARRMPVTEKFLGVRRTLAESAELEYALHGASRGTPAVALWDGSLIRWSIENEPADYKQRVLSEYLRAFDLARELRIPIAGYVSDPGSRDFVNTMRVMLCDCSPIDCDRCPHGEEPKPCDAVGRLKDSSVFGGRLSGGGRSVALTSGSRILEDYGEHRILAFYLDTGRETARVEVPAWVAEDAELLNLVHAVCFDQAQKGRGYPLALSEAHERAVIRGPERAAFYAAVERSFIRHGARITRSMKRISKNY